MSEDRGVIAQAVDDGIQYLDATYPGWWRKIDLTTMNIDSMEHHLLCQVTGQLLYETREAILFSSNWRERRGFTPGNSMVLAAEFNVEWAFRIRHLKDERKDWSEQ